MTVVRIPLATMRLTASMSLSFSHIAVHNRCLSTSVRRNDCIHHGDGGLLIGESSLRTVTVSDRGGAHADDCFAHGVDVAVVGSLRRVDDGFPLRGVECSVFADYCRCLHGVDVIMSQVTISCAAHLIDLSARMTDYSVPSTTLDLSRSLSASKSSFSLTNTTLTKILLSSSNLNVTMTDNT